MDANVNHALQVLLDNAIPIVKSLLGALAIWIIGRWVIRFVINLVSKALSHNKLDATLVRYCTSILSGLLTVFLVLAVVDHLGVPTTSFAALAAGAGLAIGAAWSGVLGNFAAGVFMILMRPFKVGDAVTGGGASGRIKEMGLFVTKFESPEGEVIMVPNGKLFSGNITNHSSRLQTAGTEEVTVEFQVAFASGYRKKYAKLSADLAKIPGVELDSAEVVIDRFTVWGPVLMVRLTCPAADVLDVHDEVTDAIDRIYGDMGFGDYPAPRVMYRDSKDKEEGEEAEDEEGEEGEEAEEAEEEEGEHKKGGHEE